MQKVCVLEVLSVKRVQEFQFVRDEEAAALVGVAINRLMY